MNQFLKTYLRARRIAKWYKSEPHELKSGLLSDDELVEIYKEKLMIGDYEDNLITYIDNPSEPVQLAAVKHNVLAIMDIDNPSEPVQLVAIEEEPRIIDFIKNPHPSVIKKYEELTGKKYKKPN